MAHRLMSRDPSLAWVIPTFLAVTTAAAAIVIGRRAAIKQILRRRHIKAYLFVINHEYKSITDRDKYIEIFKPFAKHVEKNESGTLAFQMSISDKDPHKLIIFERYASKEAFTAHTESAAFAEFKQAWADCKFEYVSKTGEPYLETELGYM